MPSSPSSCRVTRFMQQRYSLDLVFFIKQGMPKYNVSLYKLCDFKFGETISVQAHVFPLDSIGRDPHHTYFSRAADRQGRFCACQRAGGVRADVSQPLCACLQRRGTHLFSCWIWADYHNDIMDDDYLWV